MFWGVCQMNGKTETCYAQKSSWLVRASNIDFFTQNDSRMFKALLKKHAVLTTVVLALFTTMIFSACDDDDDPVQGKLLVLHASPDAPGVDLLIDDTKVNSAALAFPNNTGYLNVEAGDRNFKVNAAGTTTTVINANVMVDPNTNYSLFAINRLSSIDALLLVDDLTAPASGKAHVRFAHLSPDAPAVDVTLTTGTVLFGNASFKSVTAFTPLDAGTYNLQARVAGTSTVALEIPNVTLTAGKIYTVFARGFLTPPAGNTNALGVTIIANN